MFSFSLSIKKDILSKYVFDQRVPYENTSSIFRGPRISSDQLFSKFGSVFNYGIYDYLNFDYFKALEHFKDCETIALNLQAKTNTAKLIPKLRDLYFYAGISHFAISRSKKLGLSEEAKIIHMKNARENLNRAYNLVKHNGLEKQDREAFFLGLVYGFAGLEDSACAILGEIESTSQNYLESLELQKIWSAHKK